MTTFATWVQAQTRTVAALAGELGIHRVTLHGYLSGANMPRPEMVRKIEALTDGAVTAEVLTREYVG